MSRAIYWSGGKRHQTLGATPETTCPECKYLLQVERKRESLGIEEYSVSQTTLEQVFVALAQSDAGARRTGSAAAALPAVEDVAAE